MNTHHDHRAAFWALLLILNVVPFLYSEIEDNENERQRAVAIQEMSGVVGVTELRTVPMRAVNGPAMQRPATAQGHAVALRADSSSSLVLQTFQGPVNGNPPDPAMAVGPTNIIATVNSTINIYDKKGTLLSSQPIAVFMFQPTANVWDTHVYYDNVSSHFFVVCATGDQSTTGSILLAVSTTSDARGGWHLYQLRESKNTWLDFPAPTVTANSLVLSFMDVAAQGTNKFSLCSTEVIGLAELLSGNQSLKITRFDNIFSNGGPTCNFAYPAVNYDGGNTAYLVTISGSGNKLAIARIDSSGSTPVLDVFNMPVASYSFPSVRVPQKGSSTGLVPGGPDVSSAALRNGSLWATHTVASSGGNSAVRWYEFDPVGRSVKQFGEITGVGSAWMGAIAMLPDNQADVVYTTSSANDYASAGFAHRSPGDAPNTMPTTGVYQAGNGAYSGTRWGDFFEAWADPDGNSAWGIAEYWGATTYGTAIVQLASSKEVSATPQISVSVNPASATVTGGDSATFSVSVTAQNAGTIALSCSGLPTGATCNFNPTSLSGSGTSTLTITTAKTSVSLWPAGRWGITALAIAFGLVLLPGSRRRTRGLSLTVIAVALTAFMACGGTASSNHSTTPPSVPSTPSTPPPPTSGPPNPPSPSASQTFAVTVSATGSGVQGTAVIGLTLK